MMKSQSISVLLIPGFMLDETLWHDFITHLPDHWVIHYGQITTGKTIAQIAHDIMASYPYIDIIIGFSLGGYIARQIAADYPDKIKGLTLIASSLREDTKNQQQAKTQMIEFYTSHPFKQLSRQTIIRSLHPYHRNDSALITRIQTMSTHLGYEALVSQSNLVRSVVPVDSISCPTLIIGSPQDELRSLEELTEIKERIPHSKLHMVENSGHMIPLEQPQELAKIIITWSNTLSP